MKAKLLLSIAAICALLVLRSTASGAPASQFHIRFGPIACFEGTCGDFTYLRTGWGSTGDVCALDANGQLATNYTGTITFASTDPNAVLPSPYTFSPSVDGGCRVFEYDYLAIFNTIGIQTLTVRDSANQLSGSKSITVTANQFTTSVPTLSKTGMFAGIALLAILGVWATSFRSV